MALAGCGGAVEAADASSSSSPDAAPDVSQKDAGQPVDCRIDDAELHELCCLDVPGAQGCGVDCRIDDPDLHALCCLDAPDGLGCD